MLLVLADVLRIAPHEKGDIYTLAFGKSSTKKYHKKIRTFPGESLHFVNQFLCSMAKTRKEKKIFVLDTSVIIYEHNSILNFAEHDVGIPITVLEELDNFKKGNDTKNFEAREFIAPHRQAGQRTDAAHTGTPSTAGPRASSKY